MSPFYLHLPYPFLSPYPTFNLLPLFQFSRHLSCFIHYVVPYGLISGTPVLYCEPCLVPRLTLRRPNRPSSTPPLWSILCSSSRYSLLGFGCRTVAVQNNVDLDFGPHGLSTDLKDFQNLVRRAVWLAEAYRLFNNGKARTNSNGLRKSKWKCIQ